MLHYQELTRKSISKSTVKYNKALRSEIKASYADNDTKKGISNLINMHEIDVGFFLVISISTQRYMSVSTGNIYKVLYLRESIS